MVNGQPPNNQNQNQNLNQNHNHNQTHNNPNHNNQTHCGATQLTNPKSSQILAKSIGEFFKRDLISIPLVKSQPHNSVSQKCNLKSATLELDTSAFPNIEYIAGTRLSIYPVNPNDDVKSIMRHLLDDLGPASSLNQNINKKLRSNDQFANWSQHFKQDSLRLALTHLYDITMAPSRDLLRLICDSCTNHDHKNKLLLISKSDDNWERWLCQSLRTLRSTLEEFNSCKSLSARSLLAELALQQPRLYSMSSIKSSNRFSAEIIVFQHKFTSKNISVALINSKERDKIRKLDTNQPLSPSDRSSNADTNSRRSANSVRSLRSMVTVSASPITTQQVHRVPSYSGPLMSMYAINSTLGTSASQMSKVESSLGPKSKLSSNLTHSLVSEQKQTSQEKSHDGLCSNYLLNLSIGEYIVCEFVENPRFTLKGNRERPIMMIGQDVGVVAFRPFWQQRTLEHDRAQIFYTLFKDLAPKKFGEMQLVCVTGNKCKVEDLFKREINRALTHKILSSSSHVNRSHFVTLLDSAAALSNGGLAMKSVKDHNARASKINIESNDLLDLGNRIAKLLIESNGCLYTCCDPQITQAIEILTVESIARLHQANGLNREKIMSLLPKWKGRKASEMKANQTNDDKYLFTLENPFERAQIVQEIYDSSI